MTRLRGRRLNERERNAWERRFSSRPLTSSAKVRFTTISAARSFGSISLANAFIAFFSARSVTRSGRRQTFRPPSGCAQTEARFSDFAIADYGGDFRTFAVVEPDLPDNRLNEGRVGPDGAFWVGTMQNNLHPDGSPKAMSRSSGAIYRVDHDGYVSQLTPREFGITNTMAWTTDGRFLTADTKLNEIYAYDLCAGVLSNKRVFGPPLDRGAPDGSCLDVKGRLWNCRVAGGACIACIRPDGALDQFVDTPCTWPTSCAFGGPDFATLYVTSARFTMTAEQIGAHPEEGALFALEVGVRGRAEHRFK